MKIPIKNAKVWMSGGHSAVITIPFPYVKNGQIQIGKKYNVNIEVEE